VCVCVQALRPAPAVAEVQRQAQLSPLLPLLLPPEGPTSLVTRYKQAAVAFQLHRVSVFVCVGGGGERGWC